MKHPIELPQSLLDAGRRPRLRNDAGVLLMIDQGYFIQREVARAFGKLGWKIVLLPVEPQEGYIERLLTAIVTRSPDLLFTVNHIGFDAGGVVTAILDQVELPAASWFVDSPAYILLGAPGAVSPMIMTPVWERRELATLQAAGFDRPFHLPLATDPELMAFGTDSAITEDVGFVGDSMETSSRKWRIRLPPHKNLDLMLNDRVEAVLINRQNSPLHPDLPPHWSEVDRLNFASAVALEATRRYRRRALSKLSHEKLSVWGDEGWDAALPDGAKRFDRVDYYLETPGVYRRTAVNLNFTSLQMPTAVNQRLFDAPAAGGFLLTDNQDDARELFAPDEIAVFDDLEELPARVKWFLGREEARRSIQKKARARILAEHTYTHRVNRLLSEARRRFGLTGSISSPVRQYVNQGIVL